MTRCARILQYLAGRKRPASAKEVMAAVEPDHAIEWNPDRTISTVAAALHHLLKRGQVARTGNHGAYCYSIARGVTAQAPATKAAPKAAPRLSAAEKRKGYTSKHARSPRASQQVQVVKPAPKPLPAQLRTPAPERFETVDEFLARGGRIGVLPNGASANPLSTGCVDFDIAERLFRRVHESQ